MGEHARARETHLRRGDALARRISSWEVIFETRLSFILFIYFVIILADNCGGVLTDPTGEITSPDYPKRYPNDVTCTWKISPETTHVNLTIEDFAVSTQMKKISLDIKYTESLDSV